MSVQAARIGANGGARMNRDLSLRGQQRDNARGSEFLNDRQGKATMSKPLEGIKVVEIAQEIQGPFAALILADMGADVVKVENKETGDLSRWMLAALIGGLDVKNALVSHYFIAMNRGKRSITADLKKPDAIEMVRRMVKSYDVLLTNYRPGVLDRLGLGYDEVRKINPRIVYAQGSSWGPKGPWAARPRDGAHRGRRPRARRTPG